MLLGRPLIIFNHLRGPETKWFENRYVRYHTMFLEALQIKKRFGGSCFSAASYNGITEVKCISGFVPPHYLSAPLSPASLPGKPYQSILHQKKERKKKTNTHLTRWCLDHGSLLASQDVYTQGAVDSSCLRVPKMPLDPRPLFFPVPGQLFPLSIFPMSFHSHAFLQTAHYSFKTRLQGCLGGSVG